MTRTKLINELNDLSYSFDTIYQLTNTINMILDIKEVCFEETKLNALLQKNNEIRKAIAYTKDDIQDLIDELERIDD